MIEGVPLPHRSGNRLVIFDGDFLRSPELVDLTGAEAASGEMRIELTSTAELPALWAKGPVGLRDPPLRGEIEAWPWNERAIS